MKRTAALILALCLCVGLCACSKSDEAQNVDDLILAIGNVTLNSENAIEKAQKSYDALTEKQKKEVENVATLQAAQDAFAKILADAQPKIDAVKEMIDEIGTVDLDSKPAIDAAYAAYDSLDADMQKRVSNYSSLVEAKNTYDELKEKVHWRVEHYVDEFGDDTEDTYAWGGVFQGEFSNSVTPGDELHVIISYNESSAEQILKFYLYEYGILPVDIPLDSDVTIYFKIDDDIYSDSACNGSQFAFLCNVYNLMAGFEQEETLEAVLFALKSGKEISCVIETECAKYRFTFDGIGFYGVYNEILNS